MLLNKIKVYFCWKLFALKLTKEIKTAILDFVSSHEFVLQEPKPEIVIVELSETKIIFTIKIWTKNSNFEKVNTDILEFSKSVIIL